MAINAILDSQHWIAGPFDTLKMLLTLASRAVKHACPMIRINMK
jgi:hypothetical protein